MDRYLYDKTIQKGMRNTEFKMSYHRKLREGTRGRAQKKHTCAMVPLVMFYLSWVVGLWVLNLFAL